MTEEELKKRIAEIKVEITCPVVYLDKTALEMAKNCMWALEQLERALTDKENREYWYGCRWERIKDYAKANGIWHDMAAIMANGTLDTHEPPTYAQKYNALQYKKVMAEKERDNSLKIILSLTQIVKDLEAKLKEK